MKHHKPQRPAERPLEFDADRALNDRKRPYAVFDIGSNSVRLVVYDELGRAPLPRFNEKSMCRLGAGLAETGELQAEGFRRTVEAARRFRAIADAMGVARIDCTATEAVRRATNGPLLVKAIADEAGLQVRVLSGAEEAHYAAQGVISGLFRPVGLVGDMGGGSLEVAEALDDHVGERWVSLPLGALPVEALLADGVPADKLYPLDIDRAFKKLDTIKSDIIWWSSGAQSQQMLASAETPFGSFWNGRLTALADSGVTVETSWDQNITAADSLVVPKGAKNKAEAMKFIALATSAKPQAEMAAATGYAPINLDAPAEMDPAIRATLPDQQAATQINADMGYWAQNRDAIGERWYAWQAK